ncbi:MAG: imidazole glycerol phosphate synthase subunit HisH [Victivallales bacterium]|nr:imidazole glycerol phosphate synthase subunit HisH [Victivallales bacterium]
MKAISILDYGAGNLTSVRLAFERLGVEAAICSSADEVLASGAIVFPGVGSAASGMDAVRSRGFDRVLRQAVADQRPVLGICLGMQLLFDFSAEDGGVPGIGLLPGEVKRFDFPADSGLKVPEMGWNGVSVAKPHPVFRNIPDGTPFYFVHSYYCVTGSADDTAGITEYGGLNFTSAAARGTLVATQFHPERSGSAGMQLLQNFVNWEGN